MFGAIEFNTFKRALIEVCKKRNIELQETFEAVPVFKKIFDEDEDSPEALLDYVSYLLEENKKLREELVAIKSKT